MTPILSVRGLSVVDRAGAPLVRDLDLDLSTGERVGLVGESGSGKSLTSLSIMGLLPDELSATGEVYLADGGGNLLRASERSLSRLRGKRISMVFQEPLSALNPVMRVGDQVAEVLRVHGAAPTRAAARATAVDLLDQVQLPNPAQAVRAYPHQLSGGQRQRVMIAMALANDPDVLICDEPTSALDVTVQARILELIRTATAERDVALLFITHDLAVVAGTCERVLVLREGAVVESGPVDRVFRQPAHPYTAELIAASSLPGRVSGNRPAPAKGVLSVRELRRDYRRPRTSLRTPAPVVEALRGVSFDIAPGERFGIVGESGSGKSTLVRLLAGLDRPTAGSIEFDGVDLAGLSERQLRRVRRNLQVVFQDPTGSLDPRMRVREIVAEPLLAERRAADEIGRTSGKDSAGELDGADNGVGKLDRSTRNGMADRVREVLHAVRLSDDAADRFPHQFSGGQRQRISIARALAARPRVLLADEPVSALDAPIRRQVLDLLAEVAQEYDLTLVFVSHDLTVVRHVCDRVAVLSDGAIVELGSTDEVYDHPAHEYTRQLLAAVPTLAKE